MNRAPKLLWILLALICSAGILQASLPPTTIGAWTSAVNLSQARTNAASVLLSDGRILITGGDGGSGALNSAEFFTPSGTVTAAGSMNVARSGHFAVALSDGRVLVGGGNSSGGGTTNSAEIYDPTADSWTQIGPMTAARANSSAALLQDGRVLIAGGDNSGVPSNTIEVFDPSTGNFSFAGTLSSPRTKQAMAVLQDGRVLIVGGFDGTNALASCDIFDPSTGIASAGPSLTTARYSESATTLLNGQVAVIGGATTGNSGTVDVTSAEIFDPATGVFANAGVSLTTAREGHQAFLLPSNNSVLVVGGTSGGQVVAASELFVPQVSIADGSWSYAFAPTASNVTPRAAAVGSAMNVDGLLLVAGGNDAAGNALASTELYAFPVVKTDAPDYPPGTTVTISGSGFRPGEIVNLTLVESPLIDTHGPYAVTADGNGNFTDSSFATDIHDVNVRFWLSAVGSQSGLVAENTFTDATATNTTLVSTPNPSNLNQSVTLTATVRNGNLQGAGTFVTVGSVDFYDQTGINNPNCGGSAGIHLGTTQAVNGSGTAAITSSFTSAGAHKLGACYNGTGGSGTQNSQSPSITQTVNANVATTVSVSSSANPSVFGQSVSFIATVTPASGAVAPTGTIQFVVDGSNFGAPVILGACSPSPNACATSGSTSILTVSGSPHSVTANYTATGSFTGSSGSLGGQTVNKANTSSTVVSSLNPSSYGQSVTFTATVAAVSPGAGTPTGTVDFKDGTVTLASGVALSGGQASFSTSSLNAATHSITAVYSGDGNFNATGTGSSTASALSQVVNQANLTASIIGNPSKPYDGNTTAALTPANYQLTGLVGTESISVSQTAGTYNSKDVATATTVTATLAAGDFTPGSGTSVNNYNLPTSASGAGQITPRSATWTTNANSKTYGDPDPSPLTTGSGSNFVAGDGVSATYSRAAGETVLGGPYHITATLGPAAVLSNYAITNSGASFTIDPRAATWTTNANSKTYGDPDPSPLTTGSGSNFVATDNVAASYSRTAGETVLGGPYHITATLGPVAVLSNYNITNSGASFTIDPRAATWTTNPASKTYGDPDPSPLTTGSGSNFVAADGVSATYSRVVGETVLGGPYQITATLGPPAVLSNYTITNAGAAFTINARAATWTTNPASKTYADPDPSPLTTGSGTNFIAADGVTATYSRAAGETVLGGPYQITATLSPAAVLSNYTITNMGAAFTINARAATWTTNPASKTYGDPDPSPLTTGSGSNFVAADGVSATYSRVAGETVLGGPYHITATLGPVAVLSNYNITNTGASFTIDPRAASVTPNADTKVYGSADPTFTGTLSGFLAADSVTASYSRTTGETVAGSPYTISATLSPAGVLGNYTITYNTASFTITPATLTINADVQTKVYGNADPALTYSASGFKLSDNAGSVLTGALTRAAGETVAGSPYAITQGTLGANSNYTISFTGNSLTITPRPITVTPTSGQSKVYGTTPDPALTFAIGGSGLAPGDTTAVFTGALARAAGENVGPYAITVGTLQANTNYNLSFTSGVTFAITPAPLTITPDGGKSKVLSSIFTAFTGTVTGLKFSDAVSVTYASAGAPAAAGVGSYDITVGSSNFTFGSASNYNITTNTAIKGLSVYYSTGACLGSPGHSILQPINPDGSSVFKQKSTVPAKFRVCNASGASIGTPGVVQSFRMTGAGTGTIGAVDESVDSTTPDTAFRWDPTGQQWIFNMDTKGLSANVTYQYTITLNDSTSIIFVFGLR